tara:strand:- start:192 stop:350 length:159 start_codon:yes stop_codon:yes gene_type:complete
VQQGAVKKTITQNIGSRGSNLNITWGHVSFSKGMEENRPPDFEFNPIKFNLW